MSWHFCTGLEWALPFRRWGMHIYNEYRYNLHPYLLTKKEKQIILTWYLQRHQSVYAATNIRHYPFEGSCWHYIILAIDYCRPSTHQEFCHWSTFIFMILCHLIIFISRWIGVILTMITDISEHREERNYAIRSTAS